jgi:hypothetical protein
MYIKVTTSAHDQQQQCVKKCHAMLECTYLLNYKQMLPILKQYFSFLQKAKHEAISTNRNV